MIIDNEEYGKESGMSIMMRALEKRAQLTHREIADVPMTGVMARLAGVHDIGTGTPEEGEWPSADKPEAWRCRGCMHWAREGSSSCSVCGTARDGWPKRDAVPFAREFPVTPEMVVGGVTDVLGGLGPIVKASGEYVPSDSETERWLEADFITTRERVTQQSISEESKILMTQEMSSARDHRESSAAQADARTEIPMAEHKFFMAKRARRIVAMETEILAWKDRCGNLEAQLRYDPMREVISLVVFMEEQGRVTDLQREVDALRARLAERDASALKAIRNRV